MKKSVLFIILIAFTITIKAQTFVDINADLPGFSMSVSTFGDIDNDGDLDLYLSGFDDSNVVSGGIYIYDAGTYTLSAIAGIPPVYMGSADFGDINGDGYLDFVVMGQNANYTDITEVYTNNGNGTFTSVAAVISPAEQGEVRFVDFNGDSFLDVSMTAVILVEPYRITELYANDGTGNFTKITNVSLPGMDYGRMKWADYDNDGDNDFVLTGYDDGTGGSQTFFSEIYNNNNDGTFSISGVNLHKGWLGDVEWGDYNADGNIDLIISGAGGNGEQRFTLLYKNNGDGSFTEIDAGFPGVSHSSIEWADFDLDGDLDVFIVGEKTTPGEGNSVSKIFTNEGNDVFSESSEDVFSFSFYGDADSGDIDGDGKIDLVITGYSNSSFDMNSSVYSNKTMVSTSEINQKLTIFPTLAHDFTTINCSDPFNAVQLISMSGKIILSKDVNSKEAVLDLTGLTSGMYFVKINFNDHSLKEKIIVQ